MKKEFRVWCHRTRSWLHNEVTSTHLWSDYSIDIFTGKLCEYVTNDGKHFHKHKDDSEFTIQLWTGLLDKNGKKIFEGDILECPWHFNKKIKSVGEVVFWEGAFNLSKGTEKDYPDDCPYDLYGFSDTPTRKEYWTYAKIIGNIMENPEI
jgi:uncharacterized phage protein (TIGR01671 family)